MRWSTVRQTELLNPCPPWDFGRRVGFPDKRLKDLGVGMGDFEGKGLRRSPRRSIALATERGFVPYAKAKELPGPGTNHAHDVHPNVISVRGRSRLVPFAVPPPSGTRVPLEPGLVGKPHLYLRIVTEDVELLPKLLAVGLVLAIGPGLGHLEGKSLPGKEPHDGLIPAFDVVRFGDRPVKRPCRPHRTQ